LIKQKNKDKNKDKNKGKITMGMKIIVMMGVIPIITETILNLEGKM